ncbi:MAG: hypothetical protein ACRDZY_18025, partial [Acidimicrobiales bacterium]
MSGAIRRGPTTADDFTVCHNLMFRSEGLLTPSEVVVLGNVLSHKAGWETTAAGIAKQVGLCTATVKTALSGLSRKHFVIWGQDRNADGTLGTGWYFVTDIPLQLLAAGIVDEQVIEAAVQDALAGWSEENPRSAPGSNISPSGKTDTAGGPVDNSQDDGST